MGEYRTDMNDDAKEGLITGQRQIEGDTVELTFNFPKDLQPEKIKGYSQKITHFRNYLLHQTVPLKKKDKLMPLPVETKTLQEGQDPLCPICYEDITVGEEITQIQCEGGLKHHFHHKCLSQIDQQRCPVCNFNITNGTILRPCSCQNCRHRPFEICAVSLTPPYACKCPTCVEHSYCHCGRDNCRNPPPAAQTNTLE